MSNLRIYTKEELTNVEAALSAKQLMTIINPTPERFVKTRPGKGGGEWKYVSGAYIKKMLNLVFGWRWSFSVKEFNFDHTAKQVIVLGTLEVTMNDGTLIKKEQFGRVDIKYRKTDGKPLDLGNDAKAASTDALKKCAADLGFASDIYGDDEITTIKVVDTVEEKEAKQRQYIVNWINSDKRTYDELKQTQQSTAFLKYKDDQELLELLEKRIGEI